MTWLEEAKGRRKEASRLDLDEMGWLVKVIIGADASRAYALLERAKRIFAEILSNTGLEDDVIDPWLRDLEGKDDPA